MICIFLFALLLRGGNIASLSGAPENFFVEDSGLYWQSVQNWLSTGGFNYVKKTAAGDLVLPMYERTPGYTAFLLGLQKVGCRSVECAIWLQALLDSLTCLVVFLIGRIFSFAVGLVSGVLAAIHLNSIIHSAYLLTDTCFVLLVTLTYWALYRYIRQRDYLSIALAGFFLGVSIVFRPITQFAPFFLIIGIAAANIWYRIPALRNAAVCLLFAASVLVPTASVINRNLETFGSWGVSAQSGNHLMNWILPLIDTYDGTSTFAKSARTFNETFKERVEAQGYNWDEMNPFLRDRMVTDYGIDALADLPVSSIAAAWLTGMAVSWGSPAIVVDNRIRALKRESFTESSGSVPSRIYNIIASGSTYSILVISASVLSLISIWLNLSGIRIALSTEPVFACFAIMVILYFAFLTGPIMSPKYRLPTEPILTVLSAFALVRLWYLVSGRGAGKSPDRT